MDEKKKRRKFELLSESGIVIATGICYDEYNVQILWRSDIGWTGQQYHSVAQVLNLTPETNGFRWVKGE